MTALQCVPRPRFGSDRRGNVTITFGLMAAILTMVVGVAADIGRAMQAHQRLQKALDIAALAAIKSQPGERREVASVYFRENVAGSIGTVSSPQVETLGNGSLKISAHISVPTTITRLMRVETIEFDASATADATSPSVTAASLQAGSAGGLPCLHVLDESAAEAWRLAGASNLSAESCSVYVRSTHADAGAVTDSSAVVLRAVRAAGGITQQGTPVAVAEAPYAIEPNAPVVGDPYQAAIESIVDVLPVAECTAANTHVTISGGSAAPGTYCGATTFDGVTFSPGVYVIASAAGEEGRLSIRGVVDGSSGVTFLLADRHARVASLASEAGSVLRAPTSGASRGVLFLEAARFKSSWSLALDGLGAQSWQGVVYLPTASVALRRLRDWPQLEIGLVARTLEMTELSGSIAPFAWTPATSGEPITYEPGQWSATVARLSR
jgi:Flp pilus assembly protein TadG